MGRRSDKREEEEEGTSSSSSLALLPPVPRFTPYAQVDEKGSLEVYGQLNIVMQVLAKNVFIDIPQIDMNFTRAIFCHTHSFEHTTKNLRIKSYQ